MQERIDGSFGEIQESSKLLEQLLQDREELYRTKMIHFGTEEGLKEIRERDGRYLPEWTGEKEKDPMEDINKRIEVLEKAHAKVIARETSLVMHLFPREVEDLMIDHKREFLGKKYKSKTR